MIPLSRDAAIESARGGGSLQQLGIREVEEDEEDDGE